MHQRIALFLVATAASTTLASHAAAQDAGAGVIQPDAKDEGIIVVTGTREVGRTPFETLAPVDILTEEAIDSVVSDDLADVLARTLPSFNVQRLPAADGQAFVRPATLRALSPDQTLVLVNGKRYHRSALLGGRGAQAPDLNTFPSFAVSRVEVLRDGASAQYGSDAIAGVINFILDDRPGADAYGQFFEYYEGDGEGYQVGLQGGLALGDRGAAVFTWEYANTDATSRTRQRPDAIALQQARPDLDIPDPVQRWGQPDTRTIRAAVNLDYSIAEAFELYGFGTLADGEALTDFNWRNPVNTRSVFAQTTVFPGFTFAELYPAGFTPRFGTEFEDYQATGGVRGQVFPDFTYDVSASSGRSRIDYFMRESLNASLGPASPTSFYLGRLEQREFNLNADFVYRANLGRAGPLNIAFGAERREETYEVSQGEPASFAIGPGAAAGLAPNSNGFPGLSPSQAGEFDQVSYAGYLDFEWSPSPVLALGVAGRYEDFSEFGDTFDYKLSGRVEPIDSLAVRATYSTGFRAPTPGQLNSTRTSQGLDTRTLEIFTAGRLSPNDPIAVALGAEPLEPEESENISAGVVFQASGFNASVDVYQIDLEQRFGQSRSVPVPAGIPNPLRFTGVSYFTNDFDTRTRGLDAVVAYAGAVGPGRLKASLAYNYNETEVTSEDGTTVGNEAQTRIFEERLPQHNATGSLGYAIGPFGIDLHGRFYGPWTDNADNATGEIFQRFGSIFLFDAAVSAAVTDRIQITVGAENLFDTFPEEATFQANRGLIYSRNAPYDTDGGLYYVRLGFSY